MALSPAQRIQFGLDDPPDAPHPTHPGGDEFGGPLPPNGQLMPRVVANPALAVTDNAPKSPRQLRGMVNLLLAGNMQEADRALKQLMQLNPKEGLKAYIELMAFSMPQLKAMAVQLDDRSERPTQMSMAQLMALAQGETPT